MLWLWILLALAVVLTLLCLTRLGLRAELDGRLTLDITFGILRFRALPSGKKKQKKKKQEPSKAAKPTHEGGTAKKLPKPTWEELKSAYHMLKGPLKRALRRFGRGIRVRPAEVSVVLGGGEDPAAAAEQYGLLCAAIWTLMPMLEESLDIRDVSIQTNVDFDSPTTQARGTLGVSLRLGTLLAMALGLAMPALRWLLRFTRARRREKEQTERPDKPARAAA